MATSADAAQLTIQFREATFERCQELAAEVVRRSHAAGMPSATLHRGVPVSQAPVIPTARSVSLADAESLTVRVVGSEERLRLFVPQLDDLGDAVVCLEIGGRVCDLYERDGAALRG